MANSILLGSASHQAVAGECKVNIVSYDRARLHRQTTRSGEVDHLAVTVWRLGVQVSLPQAKATLVAQECRQVSAVALLSDGAPCWSGIMYSVVFGPACH